ncbi:MAG: hypothetical protein E7666_01845 [Ruminococcaceae bacterium]|nr:hypothetical protein [Oscillospiraceae bacterium]
MNQTNLSNCFYSLENNVLTLGNSLFSTTFSNIRSATSKIADGEGLSEPYLEITVTKEDGSLCQYCIWADLPLVEIPSYRDPTLFQLKGEHWIIRNVKLRAFTDDNDTLTEENEVTFFRGMLQGERHGELFFFEDVETDAAIVLISETADYTTTTLRINDYTVSLENGGNGLVLGFCRRGECEKLCRDYQRRARRYNRLVSMSNTWGDRNGSTRVCQDFILREIDTAEELGVDIVQIDDGWQMGDTAWKCQRDEQHRRMFDGDYWACNHERFPDELAPVVQYAAEKGIRTGMWFAPYSRDHFSHFDRDLAVLRRAYTEWGIRFFKLDMYWVSNDIERDCMLRLLREIHRFGKDVTVQMDVTRNERLNYLCGRQYGTVFVENRYSWTANSFPHRILRNLWMISRYLPASRFQFELLNPDLNADKYAPNDPFAPHLYSMDYLFASVMLSNPLFWMEMQFLPERRRAELKGIMSVWKGLQEELAQADVCPIGEKPSGRSMTGFCVTSNGVPAYLLLFREATDRTDAVLSAPVQKAQTKILASNGNCAVRVENGSVSVHFDAPRSYALVQLI